jgi:hypothetical protein
MLPIANILPEPCNRRAAGKGTVDATIATVLNDPVPLSRLMAKQIGGFAELGPGMDRSTTVL